MSMILSIYYMGGSGHRRYNSTNVQSIGVRAALSPGLYAFYGVLVTTPSFDVSFNYTMYDNNLLCAMRAFFISIIMTLLTVQR